MDRAVPKLSFVLVIALAAVVSFASGSTTTQAQTATPTPTPKSAEVMALEEEKAQAELRKAIAEANKAELEAKFPKPTSSPLEGKTSVEGDLIENQIMAYRTMAPAAIKLVQQLNKTNLRIKTLAIYNENDIKLILSYRVALNQLKLM